MRSGRSWVLEKLPIASNLVTTHRTYYYNKHFTDSPSVYTIFHIHNTYKIFMQHSHAHYTYFRYLFICAYIYVFDRTIVLSFVVEFTRFQA